MAKFCSTGCPIARDSSAVTMVQPALGPSLGVAPCREAGCELLGWWVTLVGHGQGPTSGTCRWMCEVTRKLLPGSCSIRKARAKV